MYDVFGVLCEMCVVCGCMMYRVCMVHDVWCGVNTMVCTYCVDIGSVLTVVFWFISLPHSIQHTV